jgi:two-component system chemotaxis response regulator CheB
MMRDAGCSTFAQDRASAMVSDAPAAAIAAGGVERELALDELSVAAIAACDTAG